MSPQQEGSYPPDRRLVSRAERIISRKILHIGADETFELGEGQSREAGAARGIGAVYFAHLRRVREILKPYQRRLMFWGDIALNHPQLIGSIPRDMIVMNWDYRPRDSYVPRLDAFKKAGLEQFVCPGVQNWNQIFPNTEVAVKNISNFVRDGQSAGALGMMNTSWDDDGETLFEVTWYGVVLGAAASWQNAPLEIESFDRNFDWAFFRNGEGEQFTRAVRALGSVNDLMGIRFTNTAFWREPFTRGFQEFARGHSAKTARMRLLVEEAEETLVRDAARARRNRSPLDAMRFAAQRFDHMGRRCRSPSSSVGITGPLPASGRRRQVQRLRRYTSPIYNALREMAKSWRPAPELSQRWLAENRPYWLDSITARYDSPSPAGSAQQSARRSPARIRRKLDATEPEECRPGARPANCEASVPYALQIVIGQQVVIRTGDGNIMSEMNRGRRGVTLGAVARALMEN